MYSKLVFLLERGKFLISQILVNKTIHLLILKRVCDTDVSLYQLISFNNARMKVCILFMCVNNTHLNNRIIHDLCN